MSFGSLVGADAFVYSERYVLLQTYTITNITQSAIQDLEFYQMLHGHPADEGSAVVYSVYDDTAHDDPLEDYEPYNDVHCEEGSAYAGNFRYDITQWNNVDDPGASKAHRDWIGFSSTVAPDFFENGYYAGGHSDDPDNKPAEGTHISIEGKDLNDKPYSFGEVAGAMGWSLGPLDAEGGDNDSVSLTFAIMFGAGPIQRTCDPFDAVGHWNLDETSGVTASDSIGSNDGTLFGDTQWVTGYIDGALEFDGDGDYVELDHGVGPLTDDSVTISAWVKPGASVMNGAYYDIFSQSKGDSDDLYGYDMYLYVDGAGVCKPGFSLRYPGCDIVSSAAIIKDEWHWVVGTNDGSTLTLYVDGVSAGSVSSTAYGGVYSEAFIAGHVSGFSEFIGLIDDVWVLACPWDGEDGCLPFCHKDYFEWVSVGSPDCWCYPRQCHGDADGEKQGNPVVGYTYVSTDDLIVLADAWQIKDPPQGPGLSGNQICADFDHAKQGSPVTGYMRVSTDDLIILANNWQIMEPPKGPGILPDCLECDQGGESAGGSGKTELSRLDMLDWLAKIWLDPDVREAIDAEDWLKLYESLKE